MDRSLVTKATSADEVPTPGYMFNEIARISHASVKDCQQLEEFLLKRLKKDNIHVKQKVLRVIKHCCQQGHPTFRREMQRHTGDIKECLAYRGTADPLHGDALNKAVRDMAQEVMNALFEASTPSETLHSTGRLQGFGSDGIPSGPPSSFSGGSYASPGAPPGPPAAGFAPPKIESGAYSSGKMQGFGNPSFSQKPAEESRMAAMATSVASGLKDGITRMSQRTKGSSEDGYASHGSYSGGGYTGGGAGNLGGARAFGGASAFQAPPQVSAANTPPANTPHQVGRPGGGWDQSTASQPLAPPSQVSQPAPRSQSSAMAPKLAQSPGGAFEERLVNEITAPGGVRASVPREELRKFSTACKSLDSRVISQLLQSKLEGGEWQCRLKALSAIEALVKEGDEQALLFFQEQPQNIQAQLSSSQASLKDKAGKVLHLIGVGGEVAAPAAKPTPKRHPNPAAAVHPPPAPEENLLDLEEAPPAASAEVSALASAAVATEHADASIGAEPASNGGASLFDNLQLAAEHPAAPTPAVTEVASGADMFSGLLLSDDKADKEPAEAEKGSNGVAAMAHDSAASSCSMSSLEMMMASTPTAAPPPSAPSGLGSGSGGSAGIGGMQSPPMSSLSGNAYNAQQQMVMMQQQMAMMQQQIMQQQQMLRYGGKPPAIQPPGMPYGSPMGVPMQMPMPGASQSPLQLGTGEQAPGGFDFMGNPGGNDAFDFVGDVISKNKKAM